MTTLPPRHPSKGQLAHELHRTLDRVFSNVLSLHPVQGGGDAFCEDEDCIVGSVGFAGGLTGMICLRLRQPYARFLTARMLDLTHDEVQNPEDVNDAIGELTNIIAGDIKVKFGEWAGHCVLSIPSIIRGNQIDIESTTDAVNHHFMFTCDGERFLVAVYFKKSGDSNSHVPTRPSD